MKYRTILLIILIAFLFLQYRYLNRVNNDFEIFQIENPLKNQFEGIVDQSYPSIFTNVSKNFFALQNYSLENINSMSKKSKEQLNKNIKKHFSYYNVPLCLNSKVDIVSEPENTSNLITRQNNYRLCICQLKGTKNIVLFSPKQGKYLYADKQGNKSKIDFYKSDLLQYPKLSETKYIEVILYPGQMLYIPYNWWYSYNTSEDSFAVYHSSDSVFSRFLIK